MPARRPPTAAGTAPAQPAPTTPLERWALRLKTARARVQTLDAHLQRLRTEREEAATAFERLRAQARDALVAAGLERCRQPWLLPLLRTWLTPFLAKTPELQSGEALATVYLLAAGALTGSQLQLLQLRQQGATLAELGAQHQVSKEWIRQCLDRARADAVAAVKAMCAPAPDSIAILHRHEHPLAGLPTPMPDPPTTPGPPGARPRPGAAMAPPAAPVIPNLPAGAWPLELSTRASNALLMANVYSLGDLLTRSPQELLKVRNLGLKSLHELQSALASHGLTLAPGATAPGSPQEGTRPEPGPYRRQSLPPAPGPATPGESPNLRRAGTMPAGRTAPRKKRDTPANSAKPI